MAILRTSQSPPPIDPDTQSPESNSIDRIAEFYKDLSAAAVDLNAASDELGKSVVELDNALKILNLGITTWIRVSTRKDPNGDYGIHKLGYTKIGGRWGIALRAIDGNESYPEEADVEQWLFNDAPRALRIEAVDKIPELLAGLIGEARNTSQKIREKTNHASQLSAAIKRAATELRSEK